MDENSNLSSPNTVNSSNEFDLGLLLFILRKNLVWIAVILLISFIAIFLTLRYSVPTYRVSSVIQIEKNDRANQLLEVQGFNETGDISGEIELLKSKYLILKTIENLPMEVSYYSQGKFLEKELYVESPFVVEFDLIDSSLIGRPIFVDFSNKTNGSISYTNTNLEVNNYDVTFNEWVGVPEGRIKIIIKNFDFIKNFNNQIKQNQLFFKINNKEAIANAFAQKLTVTVLNQAAKTIQISFIDENPFKIRDFVSGLIKEFQVYDINRRKKSSSRILDFINESTLLYNNRNFIDQPYVSYGFRESQLFFHSIPPLCRKRI